MQYIFICTLSLVFFGAHAGALADEVDTQEKQVAKPLTTRNSKQPKQEIAERVITPKPEKNSISSVFSAEQNEEEKQAESLKRRTPAQKQTAKEQAGEEDDDTIEFHFENADLKSLLAYVSDAFKVTFITDDIINPLGPGGRAVGGNKITYNTQKPLSRKEAWGLFTTFLDISGLALVPGTLPKYFRVVATDQARKSPIRSFIGVDSNLLPNDDTIIRYVYFVENMALDTTVRSIVDALRSSISSFVILQELKGFMLTDKSYNIKSLMKIIRELDKVTMPQALSVLKLRKADAAQVKKLYDELVPGASDDKGSVTARLFGRRPSTATYLPENVQLIAEPRTNSLILLGPKDAIEKIENFIIAHLDIDLDVPYTPFNVIQLKYADAVTIAGIMSQVTTFGAGLEVARSGGVRGQDKYLKPLTFIPEPANNRIVVKGDYDDFLRAKEVIERLDEAQPQVAIEVLILALSLDDVKMLGGQLRNQKPGTDGLLGNNVNFQTSGLFNGNGVQQGIVQNLTPGSSGATRLLGDLVSLFTVSTAGTTAVTLGSDAFGVWGVFQALQSITNLQVVSNPFLLATNKTQAMVSLGQTRRVVTGTIKGSTDTNTLNDLSALITVKVTPQINSDGMILLDLNIEIDDFKDSINLTSATTLKRNITTKAIVADKEVLAIGGLIRTTQTDTASKTPILGDVPILGWLFKNKRNELKKENLLVLISSRIIEPERAHLDKFTQLHVAEYQHVVDDMYDIANQRDPVYRSFFDRSKEKEIEPVDQFMFDRHNRTDLNGPPVVVPGKTGAARQIDLRGPSVVSAPIRVEDIPGSCSICKASPCNKKHRRGRNRRQTVAKNTTCQPTTVVAVSQPQKTVVTTPPAKPTTRSSLGDMVTATQGGDIA
jgi:general secretion pathway protein D